MSPILPNSPLNQFCFSRLYLYFVLFFCRYFKNDKSKDWKENQRVLLSFDTIEDFWALYNHLTVPSNLAVS